MRDDDRTRRLRTLVRTFTRTSGLLDEQRTPCGLPISVREAHAIAEIARAESESKTLTQRSLQDVLGIDKSNVTRLVQKLGASGHVVAEQDGADARHRTLRLSARGRRLAERIERESLARFARALARLPEARVDAVLDALVLLGAAFEDEGDRDEDG